MWWNVEVAGCVAVNWVLSEEAGRSVSELEEFGRLVRTVVLGRQGSLQWRWRWVLEALSGVLGCDAGEFLGS